MPLKIVHITTIDLSLRYLLLNQLLDQKAAGYDVSCISAMGPNVAFLEAHGLRHIAVPMTRRFTPAMDLMALVRLYATIRRERFDIVHTHTPKPGLLGQVAARLAGVPIVVNTLHGFYFHDHMSSAGRRFYITLEKIAATCSDVILSQNREDIQTALRERIGRPERIQFLGNGIDLSRFDRASLEETCIDQVRAALDLAKGTPIVGFVGRLVAEKGIIEFLDAAIIIRAAVPEVKFLIVGPYDEEKNDAITPTTAEQRGLGNACVFTGLRQDMPELYALMDVFVLPSHREGFPRAPMEASAMGVPCVVTDIRGCREVVKHGQNGRLVPLGDIAALSQAVIELLTETDLAQRMTAAGRQIALQEFDERRIFDTIRTQYSRLIAEKGLGTY